MVRTLTLEDRRKIEMMWRHNASSVKIAAALEISQCTVYTELKRGQGSSDAGDVVLDENFRPAYSVERGQTVYQKNLRNRGRRPKRIQAYQGQFSAELHPSGIVDCRVFCRHFFSDPLLEDLEPEIQ